MFLRRRSPRIYDETMPDPGPMPRSWPHDRRESRNRQPARRCEWPCATDLIRTPGAFVHEHRPHAAEVTRTTFLRRPSSRRQRQRPVSRSGPTRSRHANPHTVAMAKQLGTYPRIRHRPHDLGQCWRCPSLKPQDWSGIEHRQIGPGSELPATIPPFERRAR